MKDKIIELTKSLSNEELKTILMVNKSVEEPHEIQNNKEYLYTVPEVAQILKTSKNTVYDLFKAGLIKPLKLGRYKVTKFELLRFLKVNTGKDLNDLNNIKEIKFLEGQAW